MGPLRSIAGIAFLSALAACAGRHARTPVRSPAALEKELTKNASAAQAGTVRDVVNGRLLLTPYEADHATVNLPLEGAGPVFRGPERLEAPARDALSTGMDVKVFLGATDEENAPHILAVKILSEAEARELRAAVEQRADLLENDRSGIEEQYGGVSWQAGAIRDLSANALVLEPYERDAAKAVLRVDGEFDVYRGADRVGREALRPGEDVRVYFDERSGIPRVLGVEILKAEEARRLRAAAQ